MQKPEEAAAEAEAERDGGFRLKGEGGVVELELFERVAQVGVFGAVLRVDARKDHRQYLAVAGQGLGGGILGVGDGVADGGIPHRLDRGGDVADLARGKLLLRHEAGRAHHAALDDGELGAGGHHADGHAGPDGAVHDADVDDDAPVAVVDAVEDERAQRGGFVPLGGGDVRDDPLEHRVDVFARFGGDARGVHAGDADDVLDLLRDPVGLGGGQVDLVDDGGDLEVVLDRQIGVGERLGLDALRRVHHEHRALAGGKRPGDLVVEVDVSGGVDQVELVVLPVVRVVGEGDGARLDRDAALPLELHIVEDLVLHVPLAHRLGEFEDAVGQRAFAMVDMRDDAEITDVFLIHFALPFPPVQWAS